MISFNRLLEVGEEGYIYSRFTEVKVVMFAAAFASAVDHTDRAVQRDDHPSGSATMRM